MSAIHTAGVASPKIDSGARARTGSGLERRPRGGVDVEVGELASSHRPRPGVVAECGRHDKQRRRAPTSAADSASAAGQPPRRPE